MGDITIRIPQQIHIEYTLKNARLTGRILDLLNALFLRDDNVDSGFKKNSDRRTEFQRAGLGTFRRRWRGRLGITATSSSSTFGV